MKTLKLNAAVAVVCVLANVTGLLPFGVALVAGGLVVGISAWVFTR